MKRTYLLTPNFQYKPSGPIQIGNLIADPFHPTKPLSTLPSNTLDSAIEVIKESNHKLSRADNLSTGIGIWATFLQTVGGKVAVDHGKDKTVEYTISELETRYLRDEPDDEDAQLLQRLQEPRVQAAIRSGLLGPQPVYLISAVKIARGLKAVHKQGRDRGGELSGGLPVTMESVTVGADVKVKSRSEIASSFETQEDVLFAYQVHVINVRGRKKEKVKINVFQSDAAFLHSDEPGASDGLADTAVERGTLQELALLSPECVDWEQREAVDADGSTCSYIIPKIG